MTGQETNTTVTHEKVQLLLCAFHANVSFANKKKVADAGKNVSEYKAGSKILNVFFSALLTPALQQGSRFSL